MKKYGYIWGILISVILLVILTHSFLFTTFTLPSKNAPTPFSQKDRILVDRWAYGFRVPSMFSTKCTRWGTGVPQRGDWVIYNCPLTSKGALPDTSALYLGQIIACPGDTVWMGGDTSVSAYQSHNDGHIWPIQIPAKGTHIQIRPWASPIYRKTIDIHEADSIALSLPSNISSIEENAKQYVCFSRNYYWISSGDENNLSDSRSFGFVPEEFLLGKVRVILFSFPPHLPWYKFYQAEQFLAPV